MNGNDIITLFKNHHQAEIKYNVLKECCPNGKGDADNLKTCSLLQKRLALVKHLMSLLPRGEAMVLRLHLIEGKSWNGIAALREKGKVHGIPYHKRSLQRAQGRALTKILAFVDAEFGKSLDELLRD